MGLPLFDSVEHPTVDRFKLLRSKAAGFPRQTPSCKGLIVSSIYCREPERSLSSMASLVAMARGGPPQLFQVPKSDGERGGE